MGIKEGTTDYYLKRQFDYAVKGERTQATFITLREPTHDHRNGFWVLESHVMKAQLSAAKLYGDIKEGSASMVGSEVQKFHDAVDDIEEKAQENEDSLSMLLLAGEVDIEQFMNTFQKMVTLKARKPVALVDGDETIPLNSALLSKMHPSDIRAMAVRWCAFFIMSEMLKEKTISEESQESHSQVKVV